MEEAEPYRTIQWLLILSSELMQLRININLYHKLFGLKERESLKLDYSIERLWDDLARCLLRRLFITPLFQTDYPLNFDQKVTLDQWVQDINYFSLEEHQISFTPPRNYQSIEIWRESNPDYRSNPSSCYWVNIYSLLSSWWKLTGTKVEGVNWTISPDAVEILVKMSGVFQTIEELNIQVKNSFWIVSFPAKPPHFFQETSDALLLGSQLVAQRGGNMLMPVEIDQGQLTVKLTMQRADTPSTQLPKVYILDKVFEQTMNYILVQIPSKYIEASLRLETALSEELPRLEKSSYGEDEYKDWPATIQKTLHELMLFRESMGKLDIGEVAQL